MDNSPSDPPDPKANGSSSMPSHFGSSFNPNYPNLPNSPDVIDEAQSELAQHQQRDESGRFVKSEHLDGGDNEDNQNNKQDNKQDNNSSEPEEYHKFDPIHVTQNTKYSEKNDPPLVAVSVTNPITYLKLFIKRLLKNEGIDIRLKIKPLTVIAIVMGLSVSFGTGFNVARMFFPNSSPILHRAITLQGTIQKTETGQYYLLLPDSSLWTLKQTNNYLNFDNLNNKKVLVKGNLTRDNFVIEVSEVIPLITDPPIVIRPTPQPATNSGQPVY